MKRTARDALLYSVLTVLLTWPLVTELGGLMPIGGDNQHLAWALAWVARAVVTSPASLFSGNIFFPAEQSLLFSDPNVSSGLLVAPLYYATGNPALLVNALFLLSFVLCGLAAGALAREWTGSDLAGFVAGLVFAFSPMRFSHCDHVQLYTFWWTPLALLGIDRFVRRGGVGSLALGVAALVAQIYASLYLAAFGVSAIGLLIAARALGQGGKVPRRCFAACIVLGVVGGALCLPVALGYAKIRLTWGVSRTLEQNIRYAASPLAYLSAAPWNLVWGRALAGFADPVAPWEKFLFPGVIPIVLAGAALRDVRLFCVRFGLALALIAAVTSLGPSLVWYGTDTGIVLPYGWAYDLLPPLHALRGPARWSMLAGLGLALAAGAGAARLDPRVAGVLLVLAVVEAVSIPMPTWAVPVSAEKAEAYRLLASGEGALVELPLAPSEAARYEVESERVFASVLHWRPLANGYSGYAPPTYIALADLASRLSPGDFVRLLPSWRIQSVVLHLDELSPAERDAWAALESEGLVRRGAAAPEIASMRTLDVVAAVMPSVRPIGRIVGEPPMPPETWQAVQIDFPPEPTALLDPQSIGWRRTKIAWGAESGRAEQLRAKIFCPPAIGAVARRYTMYLRTPRMPGRYRVALEGECFDLTGDVELVVAAG